MPTRIILNSENRPLAVPRRCPARPSHRPQPDFPQLSPEHYPLSSLVKTAIIHDLEAICTATEERVRALKLLGAGLALAEELELLVNRIPHPRAAVPLGAQHRTFLRRQPDGQ